MVRDAIVARANAAHEQWVIRFWSRSLRGALVESRHTRRRRRGRCRRRPGAGARRRRAPGLSALGGQGAAGAAAGRDRRRRPLWLRPRGAGAGLRLASRRARPCRDRDPHAGARRARRDGAQMRRALADPPAVRAGAGARRRHAGAAAQQLLGQARGLSLRRLRARTPTARITSSRPSGAARWSSRRSKS